MADHNHRNPHTVSVRPVPRLVAGQLAAPDLRLVGEWIRLNEDVLIYYWNYRISTAGLVGRLRRLP